MSNKVIPPLSSSEKEELKRKGYKFYVEKELPPILIPWSRTSWAFTAVVIGALFGLRTFAKRSGHTYVVYTLGIVAALGTQAMMFTKIDNKVFTKNWRPTLGQQPQDAVYMEALREVKAQVGDEISKLQQQINALYQQAVKHGRE